MKEVRVIEIKEEILSDNKSMADALRKEMQERRTYLLNLMSSPGAGKTTLILKTIEKLRDEFRMGVIEGDIAAMVDSEKIAAQGISAVQLRTGGFCHLDVAMVRKGLEAMDLDGLDLLIIENVGNLVCPAEFDTGATRNAMILSVPEGDDKPLKYPLMFTICDALLINKIDYLDYENFDMDAVRERVLNLNPNIKMFEVSCKTGEGIPAWTQWLKAEVEAFKK
ncbi:MAG: hydrogenase nickel incorporation protein HypB [Deltaproteobacteria bacterium]|nr:MAG: hydrogenase nickel incorporation protein HypB [Deltaproteobacteria bacterium]